jgi:hypothetical protein
LLFKVTEDHISLLQNQQQLSQGLLSWVWHGCASNLVDRVAVFCGLWWCLGTPHVCFVLKFLLVDVWCCCSEEKGRFSYSACQTASGSTQGL